MLFEQIINGPTRRSENLKFLKNTDYPVIMFGISKTAQWTTQLLEESNIKIDGYCVSDDFWSPDAKFSDFHVMPFSKVLEQYEKFVVVSAVWIQPFRDKLRKELLNCSQVVACLEFDCPMISEICDRKQLIAHREPLEDLYRSLEDDFSRQTMVRFLNTRISGNFEWLQGIDLPAEEQYFPDFIVFSPHESVVDCGAFIGDTLETFLQKVGSIKRYFAFECDPRNFKELYSKYSGKDSIALLPYGVFDSDCVAYMDFDGGSDSRVSKTGKNAVQLKTIDHVMEEFKSDCTFIKMDIEGAESAALHGAEKTIQKYHPKLAICVYHKAEDLWTIPQYILSLNPNYKLYLRKYVSPVSCELVFYAI